MGQGPREADEVINFVRLWFDEEILFLGRIALEAEALRNLVALARIVDQHRERARVRGRLIRSSGRQSALSEFWESQSRLTSAATTEMQRMCSEISASKCFGPN